MSLKQPFLEGGDDFFKSTKMDESGNLIKSKTKRGKRDGTGPFKDSYQVSQGKKGKRKAAGEICPTDEEREKMKGEKKPSEIKEKKEKKKDGEEEDEEGEEKEEKGAFGRDKMKGKIGY